MYITDIRSGCVAVYKEPEVNCIEDLNYNEIVFKAIGEYNKEKGFWELPKYEEEKANKICNELNLLLQENAKLKSRLEKAIELPCKVGDTARALKGCFYLPYAQQILSTEMIDCEIVVIKKNKKGIFVLLKPLIEEAWGARSAYKWFPISAINKTVFLTQEEAKQALKEREEK